MARSVTYGFASLEMQRGGLSGGINAAGDERESAITAFISEATPKVSAGDWSIDPAKGLTNDELAPLAAVDTRPGLHHQLLGPHRADDLMAARSVAQVAELTLGQSLDGATVAAEVFDETSLLAMHEMCARGAKVVALSSEVGTVATPDGIDPDAVVEAWLATGHESIAALASGEPTARNKIFGVEADVLCIGSKVGALNHQGMPYVKARAIVASGAVPITTKAFVMAKNAEITVAPDFLCTAGRLLAWYQETPNIETLVGQNDATIAAVWDEISNHKDGPLLGACERAEAYLKTWAKEMPFGRPLG